MNDKVRDKVAALLSEYDVEIIHTDNDEGTVDESLSSRVNKYVSAGVVAFVSIHLGNTKITEAQLQKLLALIN